MFNKIHPLIIFLLLISLISCGGSGTKNPNAPFNLTPVNNNPGPGISHTCTEKNRNLSFAWSQNPPPVEGYQLYKGTKSRQYNISIDVALTSSPANPSYGFNMEYEFDKPYYFSLTAYNESLESGYSDEIEIIFRCINNEVIVESSYSVKI